MTAPDTNTAFGPTRASFTAPLVISADANVPRALASSEIETTSTSAVAVLDVRDRTVRDAASVERSLSSPPNDAVVPPPTSAVADRIATETAPPLPDGVEAVAWLLDVAVTRMVPPGAEIDDVGPTRAWVSAVLSTVASAAEPWPANRRPTLKAAELADAWFALVDVTLTL